MARTFIKEIQEIDRTLEDERCCTLYPEDPQVFEVNKILEIRAITTQIEYFVSWKNFKPRHNEWVAEDALTFACKQEFSRERKKNEIKHLRQKKNQEREREQARVLERFKGQINKTLKVTIVRAEESESDNRQKKNQEREREQARVHLQILERHPDLIRKSVRVNVSILRAVESEYPSHQARKEMYLHLAGSSSVTITPPQQEKDESENDANNSLEFPIPSEESIKQRMGRLSSATITEEEDMDLETTIINESPNICFQHQTDDEFRNLLGFDESMEPVLE